MPPTTASDLPVEREPWASESNTPNDTNPQRASKYPKRHASFDSPREVPLRSPSLSQGSLFTPPYFSNFSSSGTTPSASTTASRLRTQSPREQNFCDDYFPPQTLSSNLKPGQSPQSLASSGCGSSSSQSRFSLLSSDGGSSGRRFPVFEEDSNHSLESGSDWTGQTSPPSSPKETEGSPRPGSAAAGLDLAAADQTHSQTSSFQLDANAAALGPKTTSPMTQIASRPPPQSPATSSPLRTTIATPIFPYGPRPYSLPGPTANPSSSANQPSRVPAQPPVSEPSAGASQWSSSSASLPLPTQVPFHTLPRAGPVLGASSATLRESFGLGSAEAAAAAAVASTHVADKAARDAGETHAERVRQAHKSEQPHTHPHSSSSQARGPAAFSPSSLSHPAPEPPVILAPTVPPGPFLSHAPPPPDSWIEVETTQGEYRLVVHLPGFRRDGITLATKRRRILHVVADCWENGG
ncbi:hypothetical protein DXG03_003940, partial [Asterophora parasitica]